MITIISGTNRHPSLTSKFTFIYKDILSALHNDVKLLSLQNLPMEVLMSSVYAKVDKPAAVQAIQESYFIPADKFVFIFPEYNGSIPGILKLLIDGLDPNVAFRGKKASLIGIASGRAGNLRGLDHLAAILMHMQVNVMPFMLPVSRVQAEFEDETLKEPTLKLVTEHIKRSLAF